MEIIVHATLLSFSEVGAFYLKSKVLIFICSYHYVVWNHLMGEIPWATKQHLPLGRKWLINVSKGVQSCTRQFIIRWLVLAHFLGHHQTCIPEHFKKLYKLLVYLGERDFLLYTDV